MNRMGFTPIDLTDEEKSQMQRELTEINGSLLHESKRLNFESVRQFHAHYAAKKFEDKERPLSNKFKGEIGKLKEIADLVVRAFGKEIMGIAKSFFLANRSRLPMLELDDYFQQACLDLQRSLIEYHCEKAVMTTYVHWTTRNSMLNYVRERQKDIPHTVSIDADNGDTSERKMISSFLTAKVDTNHLDREALVTAIERAKLDPIERDAVTAYMANDRQFRSNVVNPNTGGVYTRARVRQIFLGACDKIKRAYSEVA